MFFIIIIFVFGLAVGSFLNVVIFRLKAKRSFWRGRSFCFFCHHALSFKDLIPILSFFILRGKCRYCGKRFSWQYPLVEAVAGAVFVLIWLHHLGWSADLLISAHEIAMLFRDFIFASFLIIIFVYDLKHYLILDKVSLPLIAVAIIFNSMLGSNILNLLFASLAAGGFFLAQFLISRGKWIGGGDIRLGFAMGLMLGWPMAGLALVMAYIIGAIIAIILLALRKKKIGSELPLGTFLSLTTFITLLYGDFIWQIYWQWISQTV